MIINSGTRTDIPAFFHKWFLNRINEGFVISKNPYNNQLYKYNFNPKTVDVLCFCSKNPKPLVKHLDELSDYKQFWFVTITPYDKDIEVNVPSYKRVIKTFKELSDNLGVNSVSWRYDPILLHGQWTVEKHLEAFAQMAAFLEGATHTCVISFIDLYAKVRRNFPEIREVSPADRLLLGREMTAIARSRGMTLRPCAEGTELAAFGADCSGCMTIPLYEEALGCRLHAPRTVNSRQGQCACHLTCDIGAYDSCGHFCRYCYANHSADVVRSVMAKHDPASPFLIGRSRPDDVIHTPRQTSWKEMQLRMDDLL